MDCALPFYYLAHDSLKTLWWCFSTAEKHNPQSNLENIKIIQSFWQSIQIPASILSFAIAYEEKQRKQQQQQQQQQKGNLERPAFVFTGNGFSLGHS